MIMGVQCPSIVFLHIYSNLEAIKLKIACQLNQSMHICFGSYEPCLEIMVLFILHKLILQMCMRDRYLIFYLLEKH